MRTLVGWFWGKVQARLVVLLATAFAAIEVVDDGEDEGDDGRTM